MINYIPKEVGDTFAFSSEYDDYRQVFEHDPSLSNAQREQESTIIQFRNAANEFSLGLPTLEYLHQLTFATKDQLYRLLRVRGANHEELFEQILENYVQRKLINKFYLADTSCADFVHDEAMTLYCLDHGGKYILEHFGKNKNIVSLWKASDVIYGGGIIFRYLAVNEFYISLCELKGLIETSFDDCSKLYLNGRTLQLSGWIQTKIRGSQADLLVDVVRHSDLPIAWRRKVDQLIHPFSNPENSKSPIRRHFPYAAPKWIFITDSLNDALQTARIFMDLTIGQDWLITTPEEVRKGLDKALFYKWDENSKKIKRTIMGAFAKET